MHAERALQYPKRDHKKGEGWRSSLSLHNGVIMEGRASCVTGEGQGLELVAARIAGLAEHKRALGRVRQKRRQRVAPHVRVHLKSDTQGGERQSAGEVKRAAKRRARSEAGAS